MQNLRGCMHSTYLTVPDLPARRILDHPGVPLQNSLHRPRRMIRVEHELNESDIVGDVGKGSIRPVKFSHGYGVW